MLKMYHRLRAGNTVAFWEEFGSEGTLAERVRFCEFDPLRPLFERYLPPNGLMLEGGCGRGQYVAYYSSRGARVIGLDFARERLSAIHAESPSLSLCAGDVSALPFADGTFDVYYSGGVVEHFEAGATLALAEARRVLKPGGVLLISVPYFSPLRKALALVKRDWRQVPAPAVDNCETPGRNFFQYAYTVPEFDTLLATAGLSVIAHQGYAIRWGLFDIEVIHRLVTRLIERHGGKSRQHYAAQNSAGPSPSPSLLKRLAVSEDTTVSGAGWLVKLGRWALSNMMMYVCVRDDGGPRR